MLLIGLSALCYTLGIMLLFKRSLILISNVHLYFKLKVFFLAGLYFFIGITGILSFFSRKGNCHLQIGKIKGSVVFFSGFILIVIGFSFFGTLLEIAGFLILFRQFLPDFYDYICKVPVVGRYLSKINCYFRKLLYPKLFGCICRESKK